MKILIATGIYPPQIGGPAKYAYNLKRAFSELGHSVSVCSYGFERALPFGIRHIALACRLLPQLLFADVVLALDTISVGFPAAFLSRFFRKRFVIRVGGDFLWESYIERSGKEIPLPHFYETTPPLSSKEKLLFRAQRYVLQSANRIVFNSEWLRAIWQAAYRLPAEKTAFIENQCISEPRSAPQPAKMFLAAGRDIVLKNRKRLERAFKAAVREDTSLILDNAPSSPEEFKERLKDARAVIVPSISEVSPNVIYEAVALAKPFIVTKYNGLPKRFASAGLAIDPLSEDDIRDKILMLADDATYARYTEHAAAVSCNRNWETVAKEFITVFQH